MGATFWPGFGHDHASLNVRIYDRSRSAAVVELADALAESMAIHFGMIHSLTDGDRDEGLASNRQDISIRNYRTRAAESIWGFDVQIPHGLPTLFWRTYFGPPYIELIGRGRLLTAPVHDVTTQRERIVLTLTPDLPADESWPAFSDVRRRVIEHLGRDLFWPQASRVPVLPPPIDE